MKEIRIDLDVHRRIEAARVSFDESENAILRRLLGVDMRPPRISSGPRIRTPRSSGAYSTHVGSQPVEANSLKELLRAVLLVCAKNDPRFLGALAMTATRRGRHIIGRSPKDIYPQSPQLVEYAEKLDSKWWFDTNVGRNQVAAYLKIVAELARLPHVPVISKRSEKTTLTLEDLDL